jgi:Spy/CpxP family protein refolding chaperone
VGTGPQSMTTRQPMNRLTYILLFLFVAVPPLFAQDSYQEFERGLNLSEAQRSQVEGIKNRYIEEWRSLKSESIRKRLELRQAYRNPSMDGNRAQALQEDIRGIEQSRQNLYNQYRNEVSRVLNDQQRQRYNSFSENERRKVMHPLRPRGYAR